MHKVRVNNVPEPVEPIKANYADLSPMLKKQINLLISDKNGRKKFCRKSLMMLMQWCYVQGIMDTADAMSQICFDDKVEDKADVAAAISIHFSEKMASVGTQRTKEYSELGNMCTVMQEIGREASVMQQQ